MPVKQLGTAYIREMRGTDTAFPPLMHDVVRKLYPPGQSLRVQDDELLTAAAAYAAVTGLDDIGGIVLALKPYGEYSLRFRIRRSVLRNIRDKGCIAAARKKKALSKHFKSNVSDDIYEKLSEWI